MKVFRSSLLLIAIAIILCLLGEKESLALSFGRESKGGVPRGIWVTVFSKKEVLYSKEAARQMIEDCKRRRIDDIYLQIYRENKAYYDSSLADRSKYEVMLEATGVDIIEYITGEAAKNNINVYGWINVLSIALNDDSNIIKKYGKEALTKDQYSRISIRTAAKNASDKYYLRDNQLFLEAGDPGVLEYIASIADEIINKYPKIKGLHLDYIRYPYPVPYVPGSRFNKYGLTYGYGEKNVRRFKKETGSDPFKLGGIKDGYMEWDNWKREQITAIVERISSIVKSKKEGYILSCAVMSSPVHAYSVAFQDWPEWLQEGIVDYVVIMNYTRDTKLAQRITKSALAHKGKGKVYVGLGGFLMADEPKMFKKQYEAVVGLKPDGIVLFSYDDLD